LSMRSIHKSMRIYCAFVWLITNTQIMVS
jgi:hypothetical protein